MADTEIKNKVVHGLFWKISENGRVQGIQFVIAIILARLLSPAEYGLVSIIMIFITITNMVVQNGFSTALMQKRHSDGVDFSSIFYLNLAIAAVMYVVLYMAAPSITGFYRNDVLISIVRVLSVVLFPRAAISVQIAYVPKKMEFKGLFKATMIVVLVSGTVSITMALRGLGVWAMAGQQISYYLALMTALFVMVSWKSDFMFAVGRVWAMFAFGWKLLLTVLLDTLFNNLYGLIMGKIYNEELLGVYNRGDQFPKLIANSLGMAIQAVLLPAFSSRQGDIAQVRSMVRKAIRTSFFLVLSMLLGLFAVADTMVLALLGEKWTICVPYPQIMCIAYSFWPIHITNLQTINAVGRSDIFLKLEVIKKSIGIMGLVAGAIYNPVILVSIKAGIDFLCTPINAQPNKKLFGYSIPSQWMDIMSSMALPAVMCIFIYLLQFVLPGGPWGKLVMQIVVGVLFYGGTAWILKMESFMYLLGVIKRRESSQT